MGKGNRNRTGREESVFTAKKTGAKKVRRPLPKLLVPIISLVLAIVVVVVIVIAVMANNGTFKRNNILVKSQSGKYDLDQQAATILLWTTVYDQASSNYSLYEQYGIAESYLGTDDASWYSYNMASQAARYERQENLKSYESLFTAYVALCDKGVNEKISFTKEEKENAYSTLITSLRGEAYNYYSYLSKQGVSNISAYYVYSNNSPYFGYYLKEIFGNDVNEKDLRRAAILQAYANKVYAQEADSYWDADDSEIIAERNKNPESYYSTEYITYTTEHADLAAALAAATNEDEFRSAVVTGYIRNNYVGLYNKYVTKKAADVNSLLTAIQGKSEESELTTALSEKELTAVEYTDESEFANDKVKDWLFDAERKQFDAATVASSDGLTQTVIVVTKAYDAETGKVSAALKDFTYEKLENDDLNKLTNTVLKKLGMTIAEGAPIYETAAELAASIYDQLTADGAEIDAILTANNAVPVSSAEATTETVPADVRSKVFAANVKEGDVLKTEGTSVAYVIVVKKLYAEITTEPLEGEETGTVVTPARADISYIAVEQGFDDLVIDLAEGIEEDIPSHTTASYQQAAAKKAASILAELNAAEDKEHYFEHQSGAATVSGVTAEDHQSLSDELYNALMAETATVGATFLVDVPDSTAKYVVYVTAKGESGVDATYLKVSTYEEGSYQEWLFANVVIADDGTVTGSPAKGESKKIDPEDDETEYKVYLITGDPMKLDMTDVVRGGYLAFTIDETAKEDAESAKKSLEGLTGSALLTALSNLSTTAVTSNALKEDSVTATELSDWFFSADRAANDVAIIETAKGDTCYLAIFLKKLPAWESSARSNYSSEQVEEWAEELVKEGGYAISEKALAKVKNEKNPYKTTESDTAEATVTTADETVTAIPENTSGENTPESGEPTSDSTEPGTSGGAIE